MPATKPKLDLAEIIKNKLASSTEAHPRRIADALLDDGDIPKSQYEEALRLTLPNLVREHIRSARRLKHRSGTRNFSQRWESGYRYWRICTDAATSRWIWLDDCTKEDVLDLVAEYERRAREQIKTGEEYQRLADLFDSHPKAKIVADLPETEVQEALPTEYEANT